jgi:hypothetical protein
MRALVCFGLLLASTGATCAPRAERSPQAQPEASPAASANPLVSDDSMPPEGVSLTPDEVDRLRRKVLAQCGLPDAPASGLPWYFHFEFGRELLTNGDPRRAIGELSMAVDLNPVPHAAKRMYGMWYVDYFPYYQLALAHSALGNWTCAANAMRLSQLTESASSEHFDMVKYSSLRRQIEGKAPYTEACHVSDQ